MPRIPHGFLKAQCYLVLGVGPTPFTPLSADVQEPRDRNGRWPTFLSRGNFKGSSGSFMQVAKSPLSSEETVLNVRTVRFCGQRV